MVIFLLDCLFVFFDLCMYLIIYRLIFGARYKKNATFSVVVLVGVCIVLKILSVINAELFNIDSITLCSGLVLPFLFKGKTSKWLGLYFPVFGVPTTIASIINIWIYSFNTISQENIIESYFNRFLGVFVTCGLLYLVFRTRRNSRGIELSAMQIILLNICTVLVGIAIGEKEAVIKQRKLVETEMYVNTVIIMSLIFYILVMYSIYLEKSRMHERFVSECQKNTLNSQKEQIDAILESEKKLRSCRHDFKAHIYALSSLAEAGDTEGLKKYCGGLVEDSEKYSKAIISGNVAVDGILGRCADMCEEKGITFTYQVALLKENKADDYELCIIFSNIMNNAIEACESGDEIKLVCYPYNDVLCILQKNPIHKELKYENGKLVTTKEDKELHGHGLDNVKTVINKYDGHMDIKVEDGNFSIELLL
ncbi:GHKL domain-containing protein [Butyrivibrio sp. INlla21]|nr:GHKL domain-containing protein [Butyrivibrio sp. INlla21]